MPSAFISIQNLRASLLIILLTYALNGCTADSQLQPKLDDAPKAETCVTLDSCLARLIEIAHIRKGEDFGSVAPEEVEVANRIKGLPGAVDALVPLLAAPEFEVAQVAAYVLSDVETIDARYLPRIIAGLDRDLNWLAPALGRIATADAAKEAVARFLASKSAPNNQESYAVSLSGMRALPFIVTAARCEGGCKTQNVHYYLGHVLKEMGEIGAQAVPELLALIADPSTPDSVDRAVLGMVGAMGINARPWQQDITALAAKRPELNWSAEQVLVNIRSEQAGDIMARRLRKQPQLTTLRDIAALGKYGHNAAPAVLEVLHDANSELRVSATVTLGYIGDSTAIASLVIALQDYSDVGLNWAAAVALGRLRATEQTAVLEHVALEHWHPSVRKAASKALNLSRDAKPRDEDNAATTAEFFRSISDKTLNCKNPVDAVVEQPKSLKLQADRDERALAKLQYPMIVESYEPPESAKRSSTGTVAISSETMIRSQRRVMRTPTVAMHLADGWLLGSDRGEWGGELFWLSDSGVQQSILDGNVQDIYRLGDRIVVIVGFAMSLKNGDLIEIERTNANHWHHSIWRTLPGAPAASGLTPEGDLFINTNGGGPVLIDAQGNMRMAACATP